MWSEPRRAHPAGVIVYALRYLSALAAPVIGGAFVLTSVLQDARVALGGLLVWFGFLLAAVLAVVLAGIHWHRFTFHVEGGSIRVEQGLLVRKTTRLSSERIQSVDTKANLLFRILGLVTLDIHTAGRGQEPEVSIPALTEDDARELTIALRSSHGRAERRDDEGVLEGVPETRGPVWRLSGSDLAIVAATSSAGLLMLAFIGPLFAAFLPQAADGALGAFLESLGGIQLVLVSVAAFSLLLVASWLIGAVATALQYWEFVTARADGEVRVERGLLQRNTRNVPLDRVQAVRLTEGLLRQMIGRVTVGVDAAGIGSGGDLGPTVLHPLLTSVEARRFCDAMLPGHAQPELRPLPARSLRRYVVRAVVLPLIFAVPVSFLVPFGWFALVLPLAAAGWGVWAFRDARWGVGGDVLVLRWRTIARSTALVRRRRVQSLGVSQHPLQKIAGLATLSVRVAASPANATFRVRHLAESDAMDLLEWVSEGVEIASGTQADDASEPV